MAVYNCLLRNKGDGTFEDVTKKAGLLDENLDYIHSMLMSAPHPQARVQTSILHYAVVDAVREILMNSRTSPV